MDGNKKIQLNKEAFENAISLLTGYKEALVGAKDKIISVNENMKKDWLGDGGNAFIVSAKVLEERFLERINDLQEEIEALGNAKETMFGLDTYLGQAIGSAIGGATTGIAASLATEIATGKAAGGTT